MNYHLKKEETFVSLNGEFSDKKVEWNFIFVSVIGLVVGIGNLSIVIFGTGYLTKEPIMIFLNLFFLLIAGGCFLASKLFFKEFRNRSNIVLGPDCIKFVFNSKVLKEVRFDDVVDYKFVQRSKWHSIKKKVVGPYQNLIIETRNQGNVTIREQSSNFPQVVNHIVKMINRELTLQEKAFLLVRGPHLLNILLADYSEFPKINKDWQTKIKREGLVPHELLPYVKQEIKNWDKL